LLSADYTCPFAAISVIITIDDDLPKASEKLKDGKIVPTLCPQKPVIIFPHLIIKMKEGFISKFEKLDVIRGIESIQRIGEDGLIRVHQFNLSKKQRGL
jgi:hypothetical protein